MIALVREQAIFVRSHAPGTRTHWHTLASHVLTCLSTCLSSEERAIFQLERCFNSSGGVPQHQA